MAKITISLFLLLLSLLSYSQKTYDYRLACINGHKLYKKGKFLEALKSYEIALSYDIPMELGTTNYNAACMASKAKLDSLGFYYLNKSILNGFVFKDYCNIDDDLKLLRVNSIEWQKSMALIDSELNILNSKLKKIKTYCKDNPDKTDQLIPYYGINGKWGYMLKNSKKKIVSPIFDSADFFGKNSSVVFYKTNKYKLDENGLRLFDERDIKPKKNTDNIEIIDESYFSYNKNSDPKWIKIVKINKMLDSLRNLCKGKEVIELQNFKQLPVSGIIKDTVTNRYILINHKGSIIYKFPKKYISISQSFMFSGYPLKAKTKEGEWYLIDSVGKKNKEVIFQNSYQIERTAGLYYITDNSIWRNESIVSSGNECYSALIINNVTYIFDRNSLTPILGGYKAVYTLNSPYSKNYRLSENGQDYFLVEDFNNNIFYVDKNANEYK